MKRFIDFWMQEAKVVLSRELSAAVTLSPSSAAPQPAEPRVAVGATVTGDWHGSFIVRVEASALARLLEHVRLIEAGTDTETTAAVWEEILRQASEAASEACRQATGQSCVIAPSSDVAGADGEAIFSLTAAGTALDLWILDKVEMPQVNSVAQPPQPSAESGKSAPQAGDRSALTDSGLDLLLDVELEASLRFGSREMTLNELMQLGPGDVVQLDRHISDAVDLIVGDKIVARGDVVLVNGNFGLRVSEIAEPKKSLESIRCLF